MSKENCENCESCGCSGGCKCGTNGVLFFLGGALVGVALGILFAPDNGRQTRQRIGKGALDLRDKAAHKFDELVGSAEDVVDDLKNVANDLKQTVVGKAEKIKSAYKSSLSAESDES